VEKADPVAGFLARSGLPKGDELPSHLMFKTVTIQTENAAYSGGDRFRIERNSLLPRY